MPQQTKRIPLTQEKFAIVDADDYDRLSQYKWYADKNETPFYTVRYKNGTKETTIHTPLYAGKIEEMYFEDRLIRGRVVNVGIYWSL